MLPAKLRNACGMLLLSVVMAIACLWQTGCGVDLTEQCLSTVKCAAVAPGVLSFAVTSGVVNEAAGTVTLSVARTSGTGGTAFVNYATANGTGIAGTAYIATSGSLAWADGDGTSKSITVPILNQNLTAGTQSFSANLSGATGAALGSPSIATVTINDNDVIPGTLQFAASIYSANEAAGTVTLSVIRMGGASGTASVNYATASGTAVAGTAYTATSGTLAWADGDASPKSIIVPILNQNLTAGTQSFTVNMSGATGAALGSPSVATVTIKDNDPVIPQPGMLQWQSSSYTVNENSGSVALMVTRTGGSSGSVSVGYETSGGTAVAGMDYTAESGMLYWADGDTSSKTVTVPILDRDLTTGQVTFNAVLANPSGNASLGSPSATTVTILDNDNSPSSVDLGCASNFITDPLTGNITADWTTRLGCSDNYQQAANAPPLKMTIDSSANLWAVSNTAETTGLSGSVLNITAGEIDNYGLLTTMQNNSIPYACAYLTDSGPLMLPSGNGDIVINNYGTLGENYNSTCGPAMVFPTDLYHSPYSITLNNYNAVWAVNGTQGFLAGLPCCGPGTAATINNYSGGRIGTSTGSALNQGNANNYRNAGMFVTDAWWSWCEHGNGSWFFNNWGYCIAAEEGIYNTSPGEQPQISLYGGPLIPSAHDTNGNLMYGGAISANVLYGKWANASLCVADGQLALSSSAPILIGNNSALNDKSATINLYNTVYSYIDPTDGSPKTVDYMPLLYDYPIIGSGAHITLHFDRLYADEAKQLLNDVAAGNSSVSTGSFFQYYDGNTTGVFVAPASWASKGTSNDSGYTYSWCNTAPIVADFTNTQTIKRPPPGVYYISPAGSGGSARQYFSDPKSTNGNPYYLVNPTTVRLVGNVPQPPGTLYVGPGWTLAIGANLSTTTPLPLPNLVNSPLSSGDLTAKYGLGSAGTSTANTPGLFTFNPNSTIQLQSAMGTTTDNVDNQPTPVTETLVGSLVIDNFTDENGTYPVSLPNLVGGGNLIQSGNSTTTLMGTNNNLSGSIYIYDGTLVIDADAGFATPPNLVFGQNDGNYITPTMSHHHPVLDLSQVTTSFPVNSVQMSGPQMGVQVVGSGTGLIYPTIFLGQTIFTIVSPSGSPENHLEAVLTGTGGIDLKPGSSLALGYWATQEAGAGEKAYDLSTFSGGTTVEAGATLTVNSRGALGYGSLTNAGAVQLAGTRQYLTTWLNDAGPLPDSPPGTLEIGSQLVNATTPLLNTFNNHTIYLKGSYSQTASGNLTLRVRQGDLASSSLGSGAGVQYETVVADGGANLNGTLTIRFMSGYTLPSGGVNLAVVQAGSPIVGTFAQILTTSDGVTFAPHPLSSQQIISVPQPTGGGSTSVLELTLR